MAAHLLKPWRRAFAYWKGYRERELSLKQLKQRSRYRARRIAALLAEGMRIRSGHTKSRAHLRGCINFFPRPPVQGAPSGARRPEAMALVTAQKRFVGR